MISLPVFLNNLHNIFCFSLFPISTQHFECVDELLMRVCKELFNWMNTVANQNEKYADKMKITNFGYFLMVIPPMQVVWLLFLRCCFVFLLVSVGCLHFRK